jgi:hypothetical protein
MNLLIPVILLLVNALIGGMLMRAAVAASNKIMTHEPEMAEPSFGKAFGIMLFAHVLLTIVFMLLQPYVDLKSLLIYLPFPTLLVVLLFVVSAFFKVSSLRVFLVSVLQVVFVIAISGFFVGIYYLVT